MNWTDDMVITLRAGLLCAFLALQVSATSQLRVKQPRPRVIQWQPRGMPSRPQQQTTGLQTGFPSPPANTLARSPAKFPSADMARDDVTTTTPLPRPTTSAPQKWLRSLCQSPRGLFPHPLDCRKYLDCWDGRVLEVYCPNDLMFSDLDGGFCDYLEYVDCGDRPIVGKPQSEPAIVPLPSVSPVTEMTEATTTSAPPPPGGRWLQAFGGQSPVGSVMAGREKGLDVFVGRASVDGHLIPCTIVQNKGCRLAWNNTELFINNYEVLVDAQIKWEFVDSSSLPPNALSIGYIKTGLSLEVVYLGRAFIGNDLTPGYMTSSRPNLVQTLDGNTYFTSVFEILAQA